MGYYDLLPQEVGKVGIVDGYRRRALTEASTLVPAACSSTGGMPCIPAARRGRRKLLGVATGDGRQLRCGWARKAVESAFQMADRQGQVWIDSATIDKGEYVMRWRQGVSTCRRQRRRMQVPMTRICYHLLHTDSNMTDY
uniref:Uncharacterized protein n=1 Tax=Oryza nivara TaxID=4536 RepID=A0A0E0J7S5_ORYNI